MTDGTHEDEASAAASASGLSGIVMSDLATLTKALDDIGIEYVVRTNGEYQYLFFGECRNIYNPDMTFETGELGHLLAFSKAIEFESGKLASYFNS